MQPYNLSGRPAPATPGDVGIVGSIPTSRLNGAVWLRYARRHQFFGHDSANSPFWL